jgi:Protein of unknown function (DUF616)
VSVAVITAVFGGYDDPPTATPQTIDVSDWVLVTDQPLDVPGWRTIIEPRPHVHPNIAAKVPKFMPHLYTDAERTVWVDANIEFAPGFVERLMAAVGEMPIAQYRHPLRSDITPEWFDASAWQPKYEGLNQAAQVAHYQRLGLPADYGLWATGVIARDHRTYPGALAEFGAAWLAECVRWGYQDQISEPWLLWRRGWIPAPLGDLWGSDITFRPHGRAGGG